MKKFNVAIALLVVFLFAGCNSDVVKVSGASDRDMLEYGDSFGNGELSRNSKNMLANLLLLDEKPETVVQSLEQYYLNEKNPEILTVAAEFCLVTALKTGDRDLAARYFLSAALFSYGYLVAFDHPADNPYNPVRVRQIWIYNQAVTHFYSYLREKKLPGEFAYTFYTIDGKPVSFRKPRYKLPLPKSAYKDFIPCADYKFENLLLDSYRYGVGCPLICVIGEPTKYFPADSSFAATLVMQFKRDGDSGYAANLLYMDPYSKDTVDFSTRDGATMTMPLAMDFSTPIAYRSRNPLKVGGLFYMLRPDLTDSSAGLYMMEPFQPDKIPLVLIHGLMSDMRTWIQLANTLQGDPVLRRNYQFWGYTYSSGNPILLSAAHFRKALKDAREEMSQAGYDMSQFDRMVLIGHSMGGLIAKTAITDSGDRFYTEVLNHSRQEILSALKKDSQRQEVDDMLTFHPLPFVKRVIFCAVPHRGSVWANSSIGVLGVNLIRLPISLVNNSREIVGSLGILLSNSTKLLNPDGKPHIRTGIENLDPGDPVLNTLARLPFEKGIPYHSIIGNQKAAGIPGGSDGIVEYSSSHLDGAKSELVVKSSHSVQQQPLAIHEIQRILKLHLKENSGKK